MTRSKRFTVGYVTPSLNELLRMNRWERKRQQVALANEIFVVAREAGVPVAAQGEFRELTIYSFRPRLLDRDNLIGGAKGFLDSLREAKVIWDDGPKHLKATYVQTVDTKHPRTEVVVTIGGKP